MLKKKLIINNKEYPLNVLDGNDVYIGLKGDTILDKMCLLKFDYITFVSITTTKMKFNIDIIFLQENTVVSIHNNISPQNDIILDFADSVLETDANFAKSNNIKVGDKLEIL